MPSHFQQPRTWNCEKLKQRNSDLGVVQRDLVRVNLALTCSLPQLDFLFVLLFFSTANTKLHLSKIHSPSFARVLVVFLPFEDESLGLVWRRCGILLDVF